MKIAVTSTGNTLDSQVDPRFGRAAYFLVVDTETMEFECISNDAVSAAGGAGISAAKTVADSGAKARASSASARSTAAPTPGRSRGGCRS